MFLQSVQDAGEASVWRQQGEGQWRGGQAHWGACQSPRVLHHWLEGGGSGWRRRQHQGMDFL